MPATFKGLSTIEKTKPPYTLRDIDLVKRDLMNHFYTRKGERVMMPDFGSSIQDFIFEPKVDHIIDDIREEIYTVISSDPRVEFVDMELTEEEHLVKIAIDLLYQPGDIADTLYLKFTEES